MFVHALLHGRRETRRSHAKGVDGIRTGQCARRGACRALWPCATRMCAENGAGQERAVHAAEGIGNVEVLSDGAQSSKWKGPRGMTEDVVTILKQRITIMDLVAPELNLKPSGRNLKACCPFHTEKTPSFHVRPELNTYYCFGCGKKGDIISFERERHNLSFQEAIDSLAKRFEVQDALRLLENASARTKVLSRAEILAKREQERRAEKMYKALELAQQFYTELLEAQPPSAACKQYLTERGISAEMSAAFKLGHAPAVWSALYDRLSAAGVDDEIMAEANLIIPSKDGKGFIDVFRGRLIIPIIDPSGRVIAFGGRILDSESRGYGPKYLNSKESIVFQKRFNLFGAHFLSKSRPECVVIVEGYLDVIAMHQAGVQNSVACLGTALTAQQLLSAANLAVQRKVVLNFDNDRAGRATVLRLINDGIIPDAQKEGNISVYVAQLPNGCKDPDDALKTMTGEEYEKRVITTALGWVEFGGDALLSDSDEDEEASRDDEEESKSGVQASAPQETFAEKAAKMVEELAALLRSGYNMKKLDSQSANEIQLLAGDFARRLAIKLERLDLEQVFLGQILASVGIKDKARVSFGDNLNPAPTPKAKQGMSSRGNGPGRSASSSVQARKRQIEKRNRLEAVPMASAEPETKPVDIQRLLDERDREREEIRKLPYAEQLKVQQHKERERIDNLRLSCEAKFLKLMLLHRSWREYCFGLVRSEEMPLNNKAFFWFANFLAKCADVPKEEIRENLKAFADDEEFRNTFIELEPLFEVSEMDRIELAYPFELIEAIKIKIALQETDHTRGCLFSDMLLLGFEYNALKGQGKDEEAELILQKQKDLKAQVDALGAKYEALLEAEQRLASSVKG
ncbi:DNA primase [Porphyridium purpureum]|uniref:DNA primase n=1 Tax=Porphyridium purpureum TaxID=35688 RepID=A0A5J4YXI3_PORPP|nr:DNA primase [Porphyridium purpureum]|eukprot:POR0315..scf209_3